jgi:glucan biosynthesis protein C
MNSTSVYSSSPAALPLPESSRLDYLDATRAFALLLGIVFHGCLSFMPVFIGWAVQDISTSPLVGRFSTVSHTFRMETFFLIAGFLAHRGFHHKGAGNFVRSRLLRIVVPFVLGWFLLRPLVVSGWIMGSASLRGDFHFWPGIQAGFQSLHTLPAGIFTGTHLWFLYYLAMITGLTLVVRGLMASTGPLHLAALRHADAVIAWLAKSRFSILFLALPTAFALWFMRYWGMDTPDQSLRPHFPALTVYGGIFLLGWLIDRQREVIARFATLTWERWTLAVIGIGAILYLGRFQLQLSHPHFTAAHVGFVVGYALTMWSLVFLTIGLFKKLCARPHPLVRYLADSSYWLYLVHLPIVVWLQVAVAEVALHWSLKLAFISLVTVAVALLSYDLFVRSTWIGWLLNGRRRERAVTGLFNSAPFLWRVKPIETGGEAGKR